VVFLTEVDKIDDRLRDDVLLRVCG
jgi:hypothetical protein